MPDENFKNDVQAALLEVLSNREALAAVLSQVQFMPVPSLGALTCIPCVKDERVIRFPCFPAPLCGNPCLPPELDFGEAIEAAIANAPEPRDQIIYKALALLFKDLNADFTGQLGASVLKVIAEYH